MADIEYSAQKEEMDCSEQKVKPSTPIDVEIHGHVGLVWRPTDMLRLRKEYRVLGNLVGSSARFPRDEPGLPLLLSAVEVQILKDAGAVRLVEIKCLQHTPDQSTVERSFKYREESYDQQVKIFKDEKAKQIISFADRIVEGKKKKLLNKLKKKQKTEDNQSVEESVQQEISEMNREDVIKEEIEKIQTISREHQIVQIATRDPWIRDLDKQEVKWSFPPGLMSKCKLETYRKLWSKGYYISEGSKFGGDFLVYMGDPVRFHAKYIVICLGKKKAATSSTRPLELISRSRLGNQVRKTVLVSSLVNNEIVFTSIRRPKPVSSPLQSHDPTLHRPDPVVEQ